MAGGEASLGYTAKLVRDGTVIAVAGGEASLGYTALRAARCASKLWLAGKRRSDTLLASFHSRMRVLWLAGKRRSDTLSSRAEPIKAALWLAGKRRSDTLAAVPP